MTDSAAKPSFALREYLKLLIEFDELQSSGQDDSPRINVVSDAMDAPWDAMTAAERDFARKTLAVLNEAWVEVNPMLGRVAAAPRNGHGLTANMMERLAVACWKEGEPFSGIEPGLLSLLAYVATKWNFDAGEEAEEMLALGGAAPLPGAPSRLRSGD